MQIQTIVTLGDGDVLGATADEAALAVLSALGGNPRKDHSLLSVHQHEQGVAGTPPLPTNVETLPPGEIDDKPTL